MLTSRDPPHPILDKGLPTLPIWEISDLHRDLGKAGIYWKAGGASSAMPHLFTADSSRKAGEIVWSQVPVGTYTLTAEVWLSRDWASSKRVKSLAVSWPFDIWRIVFH
jgi:hypothetical protein